MNYNEALDFLHSRLRLGSKLGLDNIGELLRRLGNPQDNLKYVHVAGTNGKGSTTAYIANVLMKCGHKTGMYISPFIRSFNERISINNVNILNESLAKCTEMVKNVLTDDLPATEFEIITAVAFLYFSLEKCDFVVLEVGLGGRYDATNIIKSPHVCVITSISIDHTELLGDTAPKIAFEKCGIIKSGAKVAAYCSNPEDVNKVISKISAERGCELKFGDKNEIVVISQCDRYSRFMYKGLFYEIAMLGKHQIYNAVTAITACELLGINYQKIAEGLKETKFGGRFEIMQKEPTVIVDGAHNFDAAKVLKDTLTTCFGGKNIILVMGMLKDKEYEKCINELAPLAKLFIATEPDNSRLLPAGAMAEVAKKTNSNVVCIQNRKESFAYAKEQAKKDDVICVCGSLYLIGDII